MNGKRALVVDDSRSARTVLRRMLERHGLAVDTSESAEEALDYLVRRRPDVIFMDHMMPGMNGLQAVRAIKSNPHTATIPIMMYTSREGEAYLSQARALGALGVLPKEAGPAELARVLESLNLLPGAPEPPGAVLPELAREAAEEAVRRALEGGLETLRRQLREDVQADLAVLESRLARRRRIPLLLLASLALLTPPLYLIANRSPPAPSAPRAPASAAAAEPSSLLGALAIQRMRARQERSQLLEMVSWALNQAGEYGFEELPFGSERQALLSDLLSRLSATGFKGVLRLESHLGRFCLVRDSGGELRLAPPELPMQACDALGVDPALAVSLGERQSVAFANLLASSAAGGIRVELVSHGLDQPRYPYPSPAAVSTAGQWNALAQRNQRVEVRLLPAP